MAVVALPPYWSNPFRRPDVIVPAFDWKSVPPKRKEQK